jgi:hypothetical protein
VEYMVRLRTTKFSNAMALAGIKSNYASAKGMGVNRSTVKRVRTGELQPGSAFIAGGLVAFAPMPFDDLFEVVTV